MQFKPITAIIVLLLLVASLSAAGCINNQNQTKETPTTAAASRIPTAVPTARPAQAIVSAQYQGGYVAPEYYKGAPPPGYEYIKYYVTVTNLDQGGAIGPLFFTLFDSANGSYPMSYVTFTAANQLKTIPSPNPGDSVSGVVIFEIKQGATPQKLVYNHYSYNVTVTL